MVVGCEVTSKGEAHIVHVAVLDGDHVVRTDEWPAPAGEDAASALAELRVRAGDLLTHVRPTALALWRFEGSHKGVRVETARAKLRAEGVVLGVAGDQGVPVVEISPASERAAVTPSNNDTLVSQTVAALQGHFKVASHGKAVAAARLAT